MCHVTKLGQRIQFKISLWLCGGLQSFELICSSQMMTDNHATNLSNIDLLTTLYLNVFAWTCRWVKFAKNFDGSNIVDLKYLKICIRRVRTRTQDLHVLGRSRSFPYTKRSRPKLLYNCWFVKGILLFMSSDLFWGLWCLFINRWHDFNRAGALV